MTQDNSTPQDDDTVVRYKAKDGKTFGTKRERDNHNSYLGMAAEVEAFIEAAGLVKASAGFARSLIPAYAFWAKTYVPAPPAPVVSDAGAAGADKA